MSENKITINASQLTGHPLTIDTELRILSHAGMFPITKQHKLRIKNGKLQENIGHDCEFWQDVPEAPTEDL